MADLALTGLPRTDGMEFLGHDVRFWIELKARMETMPDSLRSSALLREVIELRGLVDFYESRADEMYRSRRKA